MKTYKNLEQRIRLECDGQCINLPPLQGIVVLNIPSYAGGANLWGGRSANEVYPMLLANLCLMQKEAVG